MTISVIIPIYNQGKYLEDCILSLKKQSFQNFEIIIVNDGSTDVLTLELLNGFTKDTQIKIFNTKNNGVCSARNFGFQNATGKYLLFLDADDKISTDFLFKSSSLLETDETIKVVSPTVELFGFKSGHYDLGKFNYQTLLARNLLVVSCLIRSKDFENSRKFNLDFKLGFEDWDFWISFLDENDKVIIIPEIILYYRIKKGSRNATINFNDKVELRRLIYESNKTVYSRYFLNPIDTFEYQNIANSKEFLFGRFFIYPIRIIFSLIQRVF